MDNDSLDVCGAVLLLGMLLQLVCKRTSISTATENPNPTGLALFCRIGIPIPLFWVEIFLENFKTFVNYELINEVPITSCALFTTSVKIIISERRNKILIRK